MTNCWGIDIGSPRCFTRYCLVHNGLRCSIVLGFLVKEDLIETTVSLSKKLHPVSRVAHTSKCQFSTLEKTKLGYHPTLSSVLRKSFQQIVHDKNQMRSFGRCRQQVAPFAPLSQLSHSKDFDFQSFSSSAYWNRRWYVRWHPCNKAHHWSRFRCDSFFSWIVLWSVCNDFRTNCRTEMADIEPAQQMIPFVTCEISFG